MINIDDVVPGQIYSMLGDWKSGDKVVAHILVIQETPCSRYIRRCVDVLITWHDGKLEFQDEYRFLNTSLKRIV